MPAEEAVRSPRPAGRGEPASNIHVSTRAADAPGAGLSAWRKGTH